MSKPKQLRCYTCLQLDRELRPLKPHAKCLLTMLCPEMFLQRAKYPDTTEYLICWECEYMADKVKRFQDKLKKAHEILKLSLKGKITIVEELSTQQITKVEIISIPSQTQKLSEKAPILPLMPPILPRKTQTLPQNPLILPQKPPILPGKPQILPQKPPILPGKPQILPQRPPILPGKPQILPQKPSNLPPKPSFIINPQNILKLSLKDMLNASKNHTKTTVKIELSSSDDEDTLSCSSELLDEGSCNDFDELIQPTTIQQVSCEPLLVLRQNQPMPWREIEVPPVNTNPIKHEVVTPETTPHYAFPKGQILRGFREPVKVTVQNPSLIKEKEEDPAKSLKKNDLLRNLLTKPSIIDEQFLLRRLPLPPKEPECSRLDTCVNDCHCCQKDEAKLITLNEKELIAFREKRKKYPVYVTSPYKCERCIEWFRRREKFDEHNLKHDDETRGKLICGICEQRFADKNDLNVHYKQHFIVYECMKCPYRSNDRLKLSTHSRLMHEESSFTCKKCFEVFKTIRDRRIHTIKEHDQKLPCKECTKTFPNTSRLNLHIQNVHRAESVKCHICKRKIKPYYLKNHIKSHTNQGDKEYCVECKVFFKTKYSYRLHLKNSLKHNTLEKLGYKCDHCDKYFGSKESLKNHIAEIGGVKYTCDICKKNSKSKKVLASHIAKVHYKIMPKTKPKICEFCGQSFTIRKSLVEHINKHLGIRPHVCKDCGATFVYSAALFTHRRLVHKVKRKSDMTS